MKRRRKDSLGKHMPAVHLYKEDLQELCDILSEEGGELSFKTEKIEYDNLEELLSNESDDLKRLEISRQSSYVSVRFDHRDVWLYSQEDSLKAKGLYFSIQEFLKSKRRLRIIRFILVLAISLGVVSHVVFEFLGAGGHVAFQPLFSIVVLLGLIAVPFFLCIQRNVIVRESRSKKSVWIRNRDIVGAVIAGLIVLIGNWLFEIWFR